MEDVRYGKLTLKRGDKDKAKRWGGQRRNSEASHVTQLQKDLHTLGVFIWKIDGDFGQKTERAVRMFQWNAKNFQKRLKDGKAVTDHSKFLGGINGTTDKATRLEIARWLNEGFSATGDLTRIKESKLSHIELGNGFKKITHPEINGDELVIADDLIEYLRHANQKAKDLSLKVVINQALRINGVKVTGAVVTPASKSQHLIGHAIDCNIVDGDNWNSSKTFAKKEETEKAKKFIKAMKEKGLRWGGDFTNTDTPHFDKQVVASTADYDYKYFFNQRMISEKQNILLTSG